MSNGNSFQKTRRGFTIMPGSLQRVKRTKSSLLCSENPLALGFSATKISVGFASLVWNVEFLFFIFNLDANVRWQLTTGGKKRRGFSIAPGFLRRVKLHQKVLLWHNKSASQDCKLSLQCGLPFFFFGCKCQMAFTFEKKEGGSPSLQALCEELKGAKVLFWGSKNARCVEFASLDFFFFYFDANIKWQFTF